MALVCSKLNSNWVKLPLEEAAIGNKMRMCRNCRNNPAGNEWELWEEYQEHLAKCMREI
jgi:hypothetical protein